MINFLIEASLDYAENNVFLTESYKPRRASNISILSPVSSSTQSSKFRPEQDSKTGQSFAKLRCQVKRDDVKVNWLRDETEITRETRPEKYRILENGKERILMVQDVREDDAGLFYMIPLLFFG